MIVEVVEDSASDELLRVATGRAIEAIEERTAQRMDSPAERAKVRRLVRRHGVDAVLMLIDQAPAGLGVPMLVRWCQRAAQGRPLFTVIDGTGPDPLDASLGDVVDLLVMALAGNPSDDMSGRPLGVLGPKINGTTAQLVGRVAFDALGRLRFGPAGMDTDVVRGLRAVHVMASIAVEARGALVGLTDNVIQAGASWPQIAAALGIGTSEAMQRYGTGS